MDVLKLIRIISNIFSDILSVKSHLNFYYDDIKGVNCWRQYPFLHELTIKSISFSSFTSWNVLHCILFPINPYNKKFFHSSFSFTFLPIQLIRKFCPTHDLTFILLIPWRMLPVTSHANLLCLRFFAKGDLLQYKCIDISKFYIEL